MRKALKKRLSEFNFQEFFGSILWAVVIAIIFRTFLFEPFKIPSGSMIPTLREGDYIFVSKFSYGFSRYSFPFGLAPISGRFFAKDPLRGDIVVFKGVKDPETFYIKRLVGLPGDKIQVKRSILHINGEPVEHIYRDDFIRKGEFGESHRYKEFVEKLDDDITYSVLDAMHDHNKFPDTTPEYMVPAGHYFLMGDNRNNSVDSRFLTNMGFIPEDRLVGKAQVIFWSGSTSRIFTYLYHHDSSLQNQKQGS